MHYNEFMKSIKILLSALLCANLLGCNGETTQVNSSSPAGNQSPYTKTFSQAKKEARDIYRSNQEAFYSGCEYQAVGKKLVPLKSTCGYKTRTNEVRASRIEWEHVVSMWEVGNQLLCWQNGGRDNCRKVSDKFRQMEADLHNLVPAIGELNADRSNYQFGMIEGEIRRYGLVDAEVDFRLRVFEPRPEVRGDIARIYQCMQQKYGLNYSRQKTQLFEAWSKSDPISSWEKEKNAMVQAIQGDSCHIISEQPDYSVVTVQPNNTPTPAPTLACDPAKKFCRHMTSCEEAKYYLNHCGRTRLDGDKDGIPCEAICN